MSKNYLKITIFLSFFLLVFCIVPQVNATEIISERTQVQKVFDNHNGTKQYIISSGPLHYKEGDYWEDIDTTIESGSDGQRYEMTKSIYKAQFKKNFTSDKIVHVEKDGFGVFVIPGEMYWINGEEKQLIAVPQETEGKVIGNQITYPNAYGQGLDFTYEVHDIKLLKKLIIPSLESLPTPNQNILDGVNPELALNIRFELDKEMDIYIDDKLWDRKEIKVKDKDVEFKIDGKTIWKFTPPKAWDKQGEEKSINGTLNLQANGKNLNLTISFPYSWLRTADFPITIDPDSYYGETTDGNIYGSHPSSYSQARNTAVGFSPGTTGMSVGQDVGEYMEYYGVYRGFLEFNTSGIDDNATVSQANLYLTVGNDLSVTDTTIRIHKFNWSSPLSAGNIEANYDGALSSTYDADWRSSTGLSINTPYASSNLDTTWIQKGDTKTQYALLSSHDVSGYEPLEELWCSRLTFYTQEYSNEAYRPYLSIIVEVAETTPPTISTYSPADNATGVTTTANLILTFDEAVDAETGDIVIYDSNDEVFETIDVTSDKVTGSGTDTITINPTGTFAEQTGYYVKIGATAFDDAAGNSYAGIADTTTWSFTTGDFTNPTISTYSPADNATGVTTTANLILTFDEAVDAETGNIVIYDSNDEIFETIDVTSGNVTGSGTDTITINPTGTFNYETSYYVQIDATAFDDTAGNSYVGINSTTTWNFTTEDTPLCPTITNAATYNAYPTCGVASCSAGYTLTNDTCVANPVNTYGQIVNFNQFNRSPQPISAIQQQALIKSPDLRLGTSHQNVKALQMFLNAQGYLIAKSGPGSPGYETNYFGKLTKNALAKFQRDKKIRPAIGYFGPITKTVIKKF